MYQILSKGDVLGWGRFPPLDGISQFDPINHLGFPMGNVFSLTPLSYVMYDII